MYQHLDYVLLLKTQKIDSYQTCLICIVIVILFLPQITRLAIRKLKNLVSEIDPRSFVFTSTIKEASGGIIKRRHIH
ncbi:MAG: DUF2179 domain-containing protein [Ginsengibacter sp.]